MSGAMKPPRRNLPELQALEALIEQGGHHLTATESARVSVPGGPDFPIHTVTLGNPDPRCPGIGYFGGVHGLERIGTDVVLSYLRSLVGRLSWDRSLHRLLEEVRLVFMPIVNPGGMWASTRANPRGVDLMRNAPVQARERVPYLLGGQRLHLFGGQRRDQGSAQPANGRGAEQLQIARLQRGELLGCRHLLQFQVDERPAHPMRLQSVARQRIEQHGRLCLYRKCNPGIGIVGFQCRNKIMIAFVVTSADSV